MTSKLMRTSAVAQRLFGSLGAFTLATGISTVAQAQNPAPPPPDPGFMEGFSAGHPYIGLAGGGGILQNIAVHPNDGPYGPGPATERYEVGYIGAGAAGWAFSNGVQIDVLGAYERNNLNNLVPVTPLTGKQTGHQESYGGFLEALYAFKLTDLGIPITSFSPYVGVGAGALWTHQPSPEYLSNGDVNHIGGTSGPNFAYEGIVGVAVPVKAVPGLAFTADYRLVGIHNAGDLHSDFYNKPADVNVSGDIGLQKDIFVHLFTVGFAYAFGVSSPAPMASTPVPVSAPAPEAARTYLVFFDWDHADLTGRAREIVAQAAQASAHVQTTRLEVNGYTDNSAAHPGPRGEHYNMGLSVRRADSVKAELVRDGVSASAIAIHGYGERQPLVQTAADTREPQNRRVEIILR